MNHCLYPLSDGQTRFVLTIFGSKKDKLDFWAYCKGPGLMADSSEPISLPKILPLPSSVDTQVSKEDLAKSIWGVTDSFFRQEIVGVDRLSFVVGNFPDRFPVFDMLSAKFSSLTFYLEYVHYFVGAARLSTFLQGVWVWKDGERVVNVGCSSEFRNALLDSFNYISPRDASQFVLSSSDLVKDVILNMRNTINVSMFQIIKDEIFLNRSLDAFKISRPAHRHLYAYERLKSIYDELGTICELS